MAIQTRIDPVAQHERWALVCIDEPLLRETVIEQISQLGCEIHTALYSEEVSVKLRGRMYDIIVIAETFAGANVETNSVLTETANFPLDQRRETFVILIGSALASRSEMQAFMYSVDLALTDGDAANLKATVSQELARKEEFYTPFNNALKVVRQLPLVQD